MQNERVPGASWHLVMLDLGKRWLWQLLRDDPKTACRLVRERARGVLINQEWLRPPR